MGIFTETQFLGLFWGASLQKVPKGAWAPLMVGLILVAIMTLWVWAKVYSFISVLSIL